MTQTDILEEVWFETFAKSIAESTPEPDVVKDNRDIKTNIEITTQLQGSFIYVLAISELDDLNHTIRLSCKKGKPISRHCYDVTSDSYIVSGYDYIKLGVIPFNFQLRLKESNAFVVDIPAPERVLKRYMSERQVKLLDQFKDNHKRQCRFEFLQVLKAF